MASSASKSNVALTEQSNQSVSLPSADSTCLKSLTTSVSVSSACESNQNVDGEDAEKCEKPQSGAYSPKAGTPEDVLITAADTLPVLDKKLNDNKKLIRPLYKYIENDKCLLCGFQSQAKDLSSVRCHLFVHVTNKQFKCETCNKKFLSAPRLKKHRVIHQDVFPYSCDLCDKKYRSRASLRNHKGNRHAEKRTFKCDICYKTFTSNCRFRGHLRIHTGERPFECGLCKKSFRLRQSLAHHLRRRHAADKTQRFLQCNQSSHDSASSSAMASATSESKVYPDILSRQSMSLLLTDSTNISPLSDSVSTSSACENKSNIDGEMCTQIYEVPQPGGESAKARSENPVRIVTIDTIQEFDNRSTKNTKVIRPLYKYIKNDKCLLCGFQSKSKVVSSIRNHLFVHVTNEQFNCETCDKKFRSLTHLRKHRFVHKDVFPFSCDLCDKKYRTKDSLRNHKRKKHGERRKFKCDFCDKIFINRVSLKGHLRVHTGELPFVCGVCEKAFRLSRQLFCHHRLHCSDDKTHQFRHRSPSSHDSTSSLPAEPRTSETNIDPSEL